MEGRRAYNNESRRIEKANGAWENKKEHEKMREDENRRLCEEDTEKGE